MYHVDYIFPTIFDPRSIHRLLEHHSLFPTMSDFKKVECGTMPNVVAAQPNIRGTVCESSVIPFLVRRRKVADAHYYSAVQ